MAIEPVRRTDFARAMRAALTFVSCVAFAQCGGGSPNGPVPVTTTIPGEPGGPPGGPPPGGTSFVFVGAGDIAMCDTLDPARQTGQLLQGIGGTVFTLGDNAYFIGSATEYRNCYDPAWGQVLS